MYIYADWFVCMQQYAFVCLLLQSARYFKSIAEDISEQTLCVALLCYKGDLELFQGELNDLLHIKTWVCDRVET
jgi:hypothetical protein